MARIVVVGAGLGGMSAAYELRETLGKAHDIVLIGKGERFSFTPSNPWLAVGWRKPDEITLKVGDHVGKHGITFNGDGVERIDAEGDAVVTGAGEPRRSPKRVDQLAKFVVTFRPDRRQQRITKIVAPGALIAPGVSRQF